MGEEHCAPEEEIEEFRQTEEMVFKTLHSKKVYQPEEYGDQMVKPVTKLDWETVRSGEGALFYQLQ